MTACKPPSLGRAILSPATVDLSVRPPSWRPVVRRILDSSGVLDEVRLLRALTNHSKRALAAAPGQRQQELIRAWRLFHNQMWPRPRGRYQAVRPGRADWEARWDAAPGRRILLYAFRDFAGSFYRWAEAINRHTGYAARLVTFGEHEYGYEDDIVLPRPRSGQKPEGLTRLIAEADLIHVKDEGGFLLRTNHLPSNIFSASGKPRIFTAYGGYMRALAERRDFREHVRGYDAVVAMTPDLIYEWLKEPRFIPHAVDSTRFHYEWQDCAVVAHSPSTRARKGTDDFLAAIGMLRHEEIGIDLIHGVSHAECIKRKRQAGLFFDQAGTEANSGLGIDSVIGWYGNSALEAAVFGIPTMAHLAEFAFDGAARAGRDLRASCAIINTPRGAEALRESIDAYFDLSTTDRAGLSVRTRRFIEDFHSYSACAVQLSALYDTLLGAPAAHKTANCASVGLPR